MLAMFGSPHIWQEVTYKFTAFTAEKKVKGIRRVARKIIYDLQQNVKWPIKLVHSAL